MDFKLGKDYSLKSRKEIDALFEDGKRISSYPFVVFIVERERSNEEHPFRIVFSAPKRTFRHAFQRNRIKRIMREAVRLNKHSFEEQLILRKRFVNIFLIYSPKEEMKNELLQKKINKLFTKILSSLHE